MSEQHKGVLIEVVSLNAIFEMREIMSQVLLNVLWNLLNIDCFWISINSNIVQSIKYKYI